MTAVGKLFCLLGKSGVGKDTLLQNIMLDRVLSEVLSPVIPYTTRPKREDESDGLQYHFVTETYMDELERQGKIIEKRQYDTVHGIWYYFTVTFEMPLQRNYIIITTPHGSKKLAEKIGAGNMVIVQLTADDKTRLERSILRESAQSSPNYAEVCRRYLADEQDFERADLSGFTAYNINAEGAQPDIFNAFRAIYSQYSS